MSDCPVEIGVGDLRRDGHIAVERGVRANRAVKAGDLSGVFLSLSDELAETGVEQVAVDSLMEVARQTALVKRQQGHREWDSVGKRLNDGNVVGPLEDRALDELVTEALVND